MSQKLKVLGENNPPHVVLFAGAFAGACEVFTTYPLDTIKTHMQVFPGKHKGMTAAAINVIQANGIRGLFFGLPASIAQVGGKVALRFTVFDQTQRIIGSKFQIPSHLNSLLSGLFAGAVEAVLWTTPTERIKIIQQNEAHIKQFKPQNTMQCLISVIQKQGIKGLYVGTVPTIYKQSASVGTRFWLYNIAKEYFSTSENQNTSIYFLRTFIIGGVVGGISTVFNHPFDVIKSRMQAEVCSNQNRKYKGTFSGLSLIVKEEGVLATMKGLSPRFARVAIAQAVTFAVYEGILIFAQSNSS
eukprot:c7775_g1_i1.p1 GENE.c7775_g1_i1~~c7775_g1_i1.p1  ORF type:complete len:300 (+),score=136.53 c7775_g1_i1:70-969(+)